MVTVHRAYGFRFVMFVNDHDPPHVHVFGQGGEARIILQSPDGLRLDWVASISRADMRKIMLEARGERPRLIEMWKKLHE